MRRALALALLLAVGADANALADAIWTQKTHAANNPLDQLPAPSAAASPSTAPVRPIDLNPAGAPCILQAPGANGLPVCSSLTGFTVLPPLSLSGSTLSLLYDNASVTINGGNELQVGAFTGAIVHAAGATTTTFGSAGPFAVLANLTSGSATPTFVGPGSSGQFLGQAGWSAVPFSGLTGAPTPDGVTIGLSGSTYQRLGLTFLGAVTGTMGPGVTSTTFAFGSQAGLSLFGVPGSSTAIPAPVVATAGLTVPMVNSGATGWGWSPITASTTTGIVANWPLTTVRTFLYDPINGSDANLGYSDVAGPYNPATQAKATEAGLASVLPTSFAGRKFRILYAAGTYATNWMADLLSGITGYGTSVVRPTATGATASATAFADDAADRVFSGYTTATNANASGYHPTGTPTTTTIQLVKVGSGSPAFSAEPAAPVGYRVRFDSATATIALRNATATLVQITGTDTIGLDFALPTTPSTSDTLYIEMPGTVFSLATSISGLGSGTGTLQIVGARFTSSLVLGGPGTVSLVGTGAQFLSASATNGLTATSAFSDPTGGSTTIGGSVRVEGTTTLTNVIGSPSFSASTFVGLFTLTGKAAQLGFSSGSLFAAGLAINRGTGVNSRLFSNVGAKCRIIGPDGNAGIVIVGADVLLGAVDITMPSQNGLVIGNSGVSPSTVILESSLTGTLAGGYRGLVLTGSAGSKIILLSQPTITGGAGDIALGDGTTVSWANAVSRGILDANGNQIMSSSGPWPIQVTPAAGTVLSGGTLTVPSLGASSGAFIKSTNSAGLFGIDATTYVPTTRTLTMTAPMTCDGVGSCDLSSNRTIATPVFTGGAAGLVPPSSGSASVFLNGAGSFTAPAGASAVTSGTGPVTFTGPGAAATTVHLNASGFTGQLPLGDVLSPTGTGFAHVTSSGWDSAAVAVDLSSADATGILAGARFPALLGPVTTTAGSLTDSLNLGAGGITGHLPVADLVPSGTDTWVLTTVAGVAVWQAPAAPGVGTVTNVSGISGQVNVVNNTSTPVISLVAKGAGAGAYGGTGIAGFSLDAFGAVTAVTPANYMPTFSWPANSEVVAMSGSTPSGSAAFEYSFAADTLAAGNGVGINGVSLPSNAFLVGGHTTNANRDRAQFFVGGGALQATGTGDNTLFDILPTTTTLSGGVTGGIYSTARVHGVTWNGSGQTITEAVGLYVESPIISGFSGAQYAAHLQGDVVINGELNTNGSVVMTGIGSAGFVHVDAFGDVVSQALPDDRRVTLAYGFATQNTVSICTGWIAVNAPTQYQCAGGTPLSSSALEYPTDFAPASVRMMVYVTAVTMSGSYNLEVVATQNGTPIGPTQCNYSSASTPPFLCDQGSIGISGSVGDRFGIKLIGSGSGTANSISATATLVVGAS